MLLRIQQRLVTSLGANLGAASEGGRVDSRVNEVLQPSEAPLGCQMERLRDVVFLDTTLSRLLLLFLDERRDGKGFGYGELNQQQQQRTLTHKSMCVVPHFKNTGPYPNTSASSPPPAHPPALTPPQSI
jgi:hypothetical protein